MAGIAFLPRAMFGRQSSYQATKMSLQTCHEIVERERPVYCQFDHILDEQV